MRSSPAWIGIVVLCVVSPVFAQDVTQDVTEDVTEEEAADASASSRESKGSAAPEHSGTAPGWWFGAYLQGAWVPAAMLKLFLDEAPTVGNIGFGAIATHRDKNGFSVVLGLGYASYSFRGPFRISGDPEQDTEYLTSSLGLLHVRAEMLWSTQIVPDKLSFEYGIGLDLGIVLGSMRRDEAFRSQPGADFQPCAGPLSPGTLSPALVPYCEPPQNLPSDAYNASGAHYNVVEKRVPPIAPVPMLPVLALRYTPLRELALKLEAAFGLMQFTVGVSAAYGVDL
jgi:hypothetical protein